jgi:hypothetical protein
MRSDSLYWWARPDAFTLFFMIPLFLVCASLPDELFPTWKHAYNFVTGRAFWIGLIGLFAFAFAASLASREGRRQGISYGIDAERLVAKTQYRAILYGLFAILVLAYCLSLPGEIAAADVAREERGRIAGIRSLVNLGPLYVTMLFLQFRLTGCPASLFDKVAFSLFVVLVMARVFASSERLAFIEVVIPIAVIHFAVKRRHRAFMTIAPYVAVIMLALFFGLTEYFRSWAVYSKTGIALTDFMLTRLLGYYATAINNGAVIFTTFDPVFAPFFTADWLMKTPFVSALYGDWAADLANRVDMIFANYASPEFSNTSGLYAAMNDFGAAGGIAAWALLGAFTGRLFRGFLAGRLTPLLLFPTWMIGVYEILRIFYWAEARYFPVLALTPLIGLLLSLSAIRFSSYTTWNGSRPAGAGR